MALATHIWVSALIRRANLNGAMAVVSRKGDPEAGVVYVRVWNSRMGQQSLFSQVRDGGGELAWIEPLATSDADAHRTYLEKAEAFDADLWVIDIEDRDGRHFLTEKVLAR